VSRPYAAVRRLLPFAILIAVARCGGDSGVTTPSEGLPAAITKLGGDNQSGVVGKPLSSSLTVRVTDQRDRPVQGQRIAFVFVAGGSGAQLIPDTAVTDADGRVAADWGLGSLAGQQRVEARVLGLRSPLIATFTATARADAPATIIAAKGTGQTGIVGGLLADSLAVLVTDRFGNPIAGQAVVWSVPAGQGSVSATNTVTGADGRAAVTRTLGPSTGTQTTTATAAGVPGSPVTFTHTATSGTAVRVVKLFGDNGVAPVGSRLTDSLVVQVQDATGNGVPGRNVNWVITTGGGSAQPTSSTTDASGKAFTVWTLGPTAGTNTLTAAVAGLPQVQFSATGISAQPAQIAPQSATSQNGTAGQAVGAPPSVRVADSNNNPVQGVTVTFLVTAGGGTVANATGSGATVNVATNASGIATLTSWTLGAVAGTNTVTATAAGTGIANNPVTFSATGQAGAATQLVYQQGPSNVTAGQVITPAVTVAIQDANGNLVTTATNSITVALAANPGGGTLGGTKTVSAIGGVASFGTLTVDKAAAGYTLAASASGLATATSGTFTVSPAAANQLAFVQQPTAAAAGAVISPPVTVAVQDAFGNTVTTSSASVTLALGTNPSGATLGGTLTQAAVAGVATFANLTVDKSGTGYTLAATSAPLTGATSGAFSIGAGAAVKLAVLQQPTTTSAGSVITPAVTVAIQDANGNTVATATNQVTIAIGTNPGGSTLGGTATVAAVNGLATFSDLTLDKVGTGYTLVASATGLAGATSAAFDITVGTGLKLVFGVQPSTVAAGSAITPAVVVRVEDAVGNLATTFTGSVTVALGTNPAGGTLSGTLTQVVSGGQASFNNLSVDRAAVGYTLAASTSGASPGASAAFTVTPGTAARLRITAEPGGSTAGQAVAPSPTVQVEDALGNVVTTSTASIAAALVANPGGGTLSGTTAVNAVGGVASFTNLVLTKAAAGYTVEFSTAGLVPDTTIQFTVSPAAPATLAFLQGPTNVGAGATMAPAVTVAVRDAFGNTVTAATNPVSLGLTGGTGGALLTGGGATAPVNGVATFSGLSVNLAGTGYALLASATGLTGAASGTFDVTAGTAARLAFQVQPSTTTAGAAITPAVQVVVQDAQGNTVPGSTASVTVALTTPNGAALGGTTTVSAVNGVASFGNLTVDLTGSYTLTATSGGLTAATSGSFNITPAAASQLVFTGQPTDAVASTTIQPPVQVTVKDAFGNTVTSATTSITVAIATPPPPGGGTLSGTTTMSAVSGVATFANLSIDKAASGYALTANGGGLPQAISTSFAILAGTGNKLAFIVQPSNTTVGTAISPAIQVAVQDASGNTITSATDSIRLSLFPTTGGLGGTVGARAVAGVATFSNITVTNAGTGYTLTAFTPVAALASATSNAFNVAAAATTTTITGQSAATTVTGQGYTVSFSVGSAGGTPTGSVTVSDGTDSCGGALAGGTGSCVLVSTTAGAKTLTATYLGSSNFTLSASAGTAHTVNKAGTVLQVTGDANDPSVTAEAITVTWNFFVVSPGSGIPTGTVTVSDGTGASCNAAVGAGSCQLTPATAGSKTLTATYGGDANFNGSSDTEPHTVGKAATTTAIGMVSPSPASFGQLVTINYSVTANAPSTGTPTGSVTVSDGTTGCSAAVATGSCSYTPASAGTKTLTVTYAGDANYNVSSTSGTTLTVNAAATTTAITGHAPDPVPLGGAITVSVSVATTTGATPAGSVLVSDDLGATCSIASLTGSLGTATGSCNLTPTAAGTRTLTAAYTPSSTNFTNSSSAGVTHTVSATSSTTTITSDTPDPTVVGQAYTVSFTVSGSAPTGNVTVSDGSGASCIGTVAAGNCSLTSTAAGSKTLTASYAGDGNNSGSVSSGVAHAVNQAGTTTTITSDTPDPSTVGQAYTVNFAVAVAAPGAGAPTGNVTVSDGTGASCVGTSAAGSCSLTSTTAGAKTLTASYAGDANFSGSVSAGASHTVGQAATTTAITGDSPDPSAVGQAYTVTFSVISAGGTPTGSVTVTDGTDQCVGTVAAGSCSLTSTTSGAKTLVATYAGDANFSGSVSVGASHTVGQASTTTAITSDLPDPSAVGQAYTVSFTVTSVGGTPTGNVTVSDGTDQCVGTVAAGSCSLTSTTSGAKTLVATYAGDANFAGSVSAGASHTVSAAATTTTITSDTPDPTVTGEAYTVSFTVTSAGGTPTGNVTVSDGTAQCVGTVAAGSCSLTSTTAGGKTLTATYAGDANFASSVSVAAAHTVNQASTTTTITGDTPDPSTVGQSYTVSFTVAPNAPGGGTPTGNVTVSDGTAQCVGTVAAGSCSLTSISAGAKTLTATYAGDANYGGSSSAGAAHTVNQASTTTTITGDSPDPSTVGAAYTVNFSVTSGGGIPTGNVTVSDGTDQCVGTVAQGSCSLTSTTAGSKTLTATYAGDANFTGSVSVGVSHTVSASGTTTTITSDTPDPTVTGEAYTVSFTVAGQAPTGNVTVSDGTGASCIGTVAAGSCSLTSTTAGAKTLTATYAGDSNNGGSVSAGVAHTVNQAGTSTTITGHTPDPSTINQAYTVTYSVAVGAPGAGTPTGNVTVSDGTDQCVGTVAAGSCSLTSTTAGTKTLTATYAGDASFAGSASAGVTHTVNKIPTTTTINSDTPDPSVVGQGYSVAFTVLPNGGTRGDTVVVTDGSATCKATTTQGSCTLISTTAGAKTLTATFQGNATYAVSTSPGASHAVNAAGTTTTITSDTPDPSTVGQAYTVSFTVAVTSPGVGTPTGNVTVSDGTDSCIGTVAAGSCSLTSTTAGTKTLTATYAGDGNFGGSLSAGVSHTVSASGTTTSITGDTPDPSVTGEAYTVSFTVSGSAPTGNVTVSDGTGASCIGTVAAGSCALTSTTAGSKTLTATYAGDANNGGSTSAGVAHTVGQAATTTTITGDTPDPSTVGQAYTVNFSVAVTSPGAGTPTGNVTVSDGTDSCIGTVAAGNCSLTSTTAGSKTLTASYAGDGNFASSLSAGAGHTVNTASTTTSITSDTPDPSVVGQQVTVSFTVTSAFGTPTGTVTVSDGTDGCSASVATGSCSFTPTTSGAKTLTASYPGDATHGSSSGNAAHQVDPFGAPDHLAFGVQPSTVAANSPITPAVTVRIEDAFGNLVTSATDVVVMAIANDPVGGSVLTYTAPVSASGGIATFSDLSIDQAGTGFTLQASSGVLTAATSNAFNVQ